MITFEAKSDHLGPNPTIWDQIRPYGTNIRPYWTNIGSIFDQLWDQKSDHLGIMDDACEPVLFDELRQEAALRAWVRQLDTRLQPPQQMPDEQALQCIGQDLDWKYGADEWWEWAIWSSCPRCRQYEETQCKECRQLVKFTELGNAVESSVLVDSTS